MYVNPFLAGVIITILVECFLFVLYAIWLNHKNKKG